MKKLKTRIYFKFLALVFLSAYLCGSFTNMLFIPSYVPAFVQSVPGVQPGLLRQSNYYNFHTKNIFQVFDRSTLENDSFNEQILLPKSVDLIFTGPAISDITSNIKSPQINPFYNHQYAYLSFCTLRI
ncbi:hypothetical protein [Mucilaginibacter sp.]|uniref:hypothetical protein n=1 Tax=Mucilaginibacter sp. TaxID=1882438 RepID=UPI00284A781C|nr:hypothetical protein [Mucilaginibacter sp.]MDR3695288.1 hypothetical protein [Mucilaginibacter sp.]